MLLEGFDDKWLEKFRSYYLERYLEIIHSLTAVYEELDIPENITPILLHARKLHPEVEEIDELIEAYRNN